jgi:hypothetical protein
VQERDAGGGDDGCGARAEGELLSLPPSSFPLLLLRRRTGAGVSWLTASTRWTGTSPRFTSVHRREGEERAPPPRETEPMTVGPTRPKGKLDIAYARPHMSELLTVKI